MMVFHKDQVCTGLLLPDQTISDSVTNHSHLTLTRRAASVQVISVHSGILYCFWTLQTLLNILYPRVLRRTRQSSQKLYYPEYPLAVSEWNLSTVVAVLIRLFPRGEWVGDEEVMGTLRIWLEFLFDHDDTVGMDMAVEVENLNINENQENVANRQSNNADEESASDNAAADHGVDLEGHRDIEDEDADTSFSSATSSSTRSSSSEDDRIRLVPYVESHDSGIDVPDSDQDNTDESVSLKRVEHADASDENSDDDPQPSSSREVPRNPERSPDSQFVGAAWDLEGDPRPGPSRKRRKERPKGKDSEDETLHRPPFKMVRKLAAMGPSEQLATTSYDSEVETLPGPSSKMDVKNQHEESHQCFGPYCDDSDSEVVFEEQTVGISQKDNQKDQSEDDWQHVLFSACLAH